MSSETRGSYREPMAMVENRLRLEAARPRAVNRRVVYSRLSTPEGDTDGPIASGRPLCRTVARARAWIHGHRAHHAGARDRRQYGHLLHRQRRDPPAARVSEARAADVSDDAVSSPGLRAVLGLAAGIHGVPRDEPVVRGGGGLSNRRIEPHGRRSAAAREDRARGRASVRGSWRAGRAGSPVCERRSRSHRSAARAGTAGAADAADRRALARAMADRIRRPARSSARTSRSMAGAAK